jgi:hypothetical protein
VRYGKGNFASSLPNYILYDRDFLGLKNIYDLQLEKIGNEVIYYANNKSELGDLFTIHLKEMQNRIWTVECIGENLINITNTRNNNVAAQLKILREKELSICDHEVKNNMNDHRDKGGLIAIKEILTEKEYKNSVPSLRTKGILFLEQCLNKNMTHLLKWKHLCKELNVEAKGKIPKWYNALIEKVTEEGSSRELSRKYKNKLKNWDKRYTYDLYDEDEKLSKNKLVTWNDNNNCIFAQYKKISKSKNFKKIGLRMLDLFK